METQLCKIKEKLLFTILNHINKLDSENKEKGLWKGQIGNVLFLYEYAQYRNNERIEVLADTFVEQIWNSSLLQKGYSGLHVGTTGICCALFRLKEQGIIEFNSSDDFFVKMDIKQGAAFIPRPTLIDLNDNIYSSGFYFVFRYRSAELNLIPVLQEYFIHIINDCERIIFRKTVSENQYLPEYSLKLLNSIFYFILFVHKKQIFPFKTILLIKKIVSLLLPLIENTTNPIDLIITKQLCRSMQEDIEFVNIINTDIINSSFSMICLPHLPEDLYRLLAQAGYYSWLYEDKEIFRIIFDSIYELRNIDLELIEKNLSHLVTTIGLSYIGYGMLISYE